ncbi:MAG: organoarsenical effux MFS transporter ArsJ [Granulosicoccus sp.]
MPVWSKLPDSIKQYAIVTGNYWAFTLTDGALRMLVILHFHTLGYSALQIAFLFLFYEFFGVITNLIGGWFGARLGLNRTMNIGLALQIVALSMLLVPPSALSIAWVMCAQALSGIAKDLNKMSAKSSIKLLVPDARQSRLYTWVAMLTGSKNALKGAGFFLGGAMLSLVGFRVSMMFMATALSLVWIFSLFALNKDLGKARQKTPFTAIFSKNRAINILSAARLFLFGARDVWFVVALPVYLSANLGWDHASIGGFLALWVIGYGLVQALAPRLTGNSESRQPGGRTAFAWAMLLALIPAGIALALTSRFHIETSLVIGLLLFGCMFAINSSLHSFLIVSHANRDGVSLDVGFYYMANAMGRLLGTVLSGWLFQSYGLEMCLWVSALFVVLSALVVLKLPAARQWQTV